MLLGSLIQKLIWDRKLSLKHCWRACPSPLVLRGQVISGLVLHQFEPSLVSASPRAEGREATALQTPGMSVVRGVVQSTADEFPG